MTLSKVRIMNNQPKPNPLLFVVIVMTLIVATLKGIGLIDIAWWQCAVPLMVTVAFLAIVFVTTFIGVYVYALWAKYHENRNHRR